MSISAVSMLFCAGLNYRKKVPDAASRFTVSGVGHKQTADVTL